MLRRAVFIWDTEAFAIIYSEGAERKGKTGNVKLAYGLGIEAEIAEGDWSG